MPWCNGRSSFVTIMSREELPFATIAVFSLARQILITNLVSLRRSTCYTESYIFVHPCSLALRWSRFKPYSMSTYTTAENTLSCLLLLLKRNKNNRIPIYSRLPPLLKISHQCRARDLELGICSGTNILRVVGSQSKSITDKPLSYVRTR